MSLLLLIAPAMAQDCDASALEKTLQDATPNSAATTFSALAACDGPRAKKNAPTAFPKMLSGAEANQAVIAAITIDAGDAARAWIGDLQSDERSSAIAALGQACSDNEAVAGWLVQTHQDLGDEFWSQRWYRSLATCRVDGIQALLSAEVDNPSDDRARFTGALEVYARNLGPTAIPRLGALAQELQDPQEIGLVINAFGDAAGLGSLEGAKPETVALAAKTLVEIAPTLPPKIIDQVRSVLIALGAQDASDALAGVRYAELADPKGNLHYGLVAVSTQGCKKGAVLQVHTAEVVQPGTLWPDQLDGPVRQAIDSTWDMAPGKKCTVEGDLEIFLTKGPVPDAPAVETFQAETLETLAKRGIAKTETTSHEPLTLP
jgi:hypothetical protein